MCNEISIGTIAKRKPGNIKATNLKLNQEEKIEIINKNKKICTLTSKNIKIKFIALINNVQRKGKNSNVLNINYSWDLDNFKIYYIKILTTIEIN